MLDPVLPAAHHANDKRLAAVEDASDLFDGHRVRSFTRLENRPEDYGLPKSGVNIWQPYIVPTWAWLAASWDPAPAAPRERGAVARPGTTPANPRHWMVPAGVGDS